MSFKVGDRVFDINFPDKLGTILEVNVYSITLKRYFIKIKYDHLNINRLEFSSELRLFKPKLFHYSI